MEQKQSDLLTPELCVFAYNNLPSEKADITSQMDALHDDFKNKRGYYLLDITNAADAYDGYAHMFDVRQKSLDEELSQYQQSKQSTSAQSEEAGNKVDSIKKLKEDYRKSEQDLNEIIAEYDRYWNISDLEKGWNTSVRLNDRIKTLSNILGNIKFNEATLGQEVLAEISNFKFHDQEGKPIAQFRDAKNPSITSDSWREGFEVIPDSQLATVLKLSGNDILMSELGSKEEIDAQKITQALKENIPFKLFEMYNSEEIIRQAIEDPKKFTENKEQYLTRFRELLNNPQAPLVISAEGYNAALDAQVNKVEVFANRLDNKLGKDNNEFVRSNLFEQVQKIDKQAPLRGRNKEEIRKGSLKRALWGIGIGGGVAYLGSRLVTNAAASGGVSLIGGSALALGTAVTVGAAATALQIWSRKKAAKRRGEKYGWKEFKKDKMLHVSIATTTLACASAAFAIANAPELAIPCAVASFGMGAGLRFAQPYRDLRLKGHNKATALALGAVNAAAVFVGGYFGRQHGLNDITPNTQEAVTGYRDVKVGEVKSYNQDLISKVTERNHTDSMWEYRGEGPHTIEAYRTPENYSNEAWWTPEQHDKAIAALKEQMPKLGWKEGVGNEEVMLRKLASFERLHRNSDFVLPDGQTVGEKFGDYKGLLHNLLEGRLSPEGAKQLDVIQYNVGENGHSKILDSLGQELYSYQDHPHGIGSADIIEKVAIKEQVPVETAALGGGVFGWVVSSWNKFKDRIRPGAKADRVEKRQEPKPEPKPRPEPKPGPEPKPEPKKQEDTEKLLLDEYKIVHGVEPITQEGKNEYWLNFCNHVEAERQATAPDKDINQFLLDRRYKLDELIMNSTDSVSETQSGERIQKDYLLKKAKDDRGKAHIVMEARQNLRQSNLTAEGWSKITLSHFTKFMEHYLAHDEVVADGSRNIELNPKLKESFKKENSKITIIDLNQYLVEGKSLQDSSFKRSGRDARKAMHEVNKNNKRRQQGR